MSNDFISYLPHVNACLNGTSAVLLFTGYTFIRSRNVAAHRACQMAALGVSLLFLASYLTYHYNHGATRFQGAGIVRPIYFTILTTHTILAIVIVPLVILTFYRALRNAVDQLKDKFKSAVIVLASVDATNKITLVAGVTADQTSKVKAGELVGSVAGQVGGKGGGRPDFAQAGGNNPAALGAALASVEGFVRTKLGA